MRAIVVDRWMEPSELAVREVPEPTVGPGMLRVGVRAAGCNFFDILMVRRDSTRCGRPSRSCPAPSSPAWSRRSGPDVEGFAVGDRVLASAGLGAFAERAVVPARAAYRLPDGMSFEAGAAFPDRLSHVVRGARLPRARSARATGCSCTPPPAASASPRCRSARRSARASSGRPAAPTSSRSCGASGADVAIDYRGDDWVERVKEATGGHGADVIYDSVGGDVTDASLKCIAWNGRLLVIGFASGRIPEVKLNRVLLKNISLVGLHWGAHAMHEPARIDETFRALFALYAKGAVEPVIYERYPLDQLPAALEALGLAAELRQGRRHAVDRPTGLPLRRACPWPVVP